MRRPRRARHHVVARGFTQLRAQFSPRAFRTLARARLEVDGVVGEVALVDGEGQGFVRGMRRWFVCPWCERRVNVLGVVDARGWVCAACGGWRSRNRSGRPRQDGGIGHVGAAPASEGERAAPVGPVATDAHVEKVATSGHVGPEGLLAALLRSAAQPATGPADAGDELWLEDYDDYTDAEIAAVS